MTDTLFADTSEFQAAADDSYTAAGFRVYSFRSNDGTYEDHKFYENYQWAVKAVEDGRLAFFIVYFYWRPNWSDTAQKHIDMITKAGGPHPKMVSMIDVETGGNPAGDQSDGINRAYWKLADWLGNKSRVIGYINRPDLDNMWITRPDGIDLIGAGYGANPNLPGQIAHQYTDGQGYGGGLPEGAPPFGNCDMNSADGYSPEQLATKLGVGDTTVTTPDATASTAPASTPSDQITNYKGIGVSRDFMLAWIDKRAARNEKLLSAILDKLAGDGTAEALLAEFDKDLPDAYKG